MVTSDQVKLLISEALDVEHIDVELNGANVNLVVVSREFENLRSIKKQQLVYGCLNALIGSGDLHAVTMKLFTPDEWEKAKHLV